MRFYYSILWLLLWWTRQFGSRSDINIIFSSDYIYEDVAASGQEQTLLTLMCANFSEALLGLRGRKSYVFATRVFLFLVYFSWFRFVGVIIPLSRNDLWVNECLVQGMRLNECLPECRMFLMVSPGEMIWFLTNSSIQVCNCLI